ncbi:hypothetical protein BXZ70DRAFT_938076 [Cristinia sonorae]|uniref:Uncharacterized protein n=1 Tax=Cristinia sonorae TaxID=1940300 RepID=A0A8K0UNP0_9AGAR|nr:hypothetical protein BXZ70DRAFT_938076 [Cristinia sonorae]
MLSFVSMILSTVMPLVGIIWLSLLTAVSAQVVQNGQVFTNGLAIVDAPQPNTIVHAGSNINLAVEVSGNGKLSLPTSLPSAASPNTFAALEFYLVSSQTTLNLTVVSGTDMLLQEPGSTVKHLDWSLPKCIPSGSYNLTAYETSVIGGIPRFSITSIPLQVENPSPSGDCTSLSNILQTQPQPANQLNQSPWLDPGFNPTAPISSSTPGQLSFVAPTPTPTFSVPGVITMTIWSTEEWPLSMVPSGMFTTVYLGPSAPTPSIITTDITTTLGLNPAFTYPGGIAAMRSGATTVIRSTVTVTPTPTPVTVIFVSMQTITTTTTAPGRTVIFTTTAMTAVSSMTAFVEPNVNDPNSRFLPVNTASSLQISFFGHLITLALVVALVGL